ncbi:MAG: glutathione peroxidase [Rickettsiales bacterium]|nr:glutathione peroxidase [Rickettsiales bacterium]
MKIQKIFLLLFLFFLSNQNSLAQISMQNAYQFSFDGIDGKKINLSDFRGKLILVVNTASKCGFTPQYKGLQNLYEKYKSKGLIIIGVPSNDFGSQEFGKIDQVKDFTQKEFHVTFPLTTINKVSGENAHPFYLWANKQEGFLASPKWNFHKYLIDKNGNLIAWFSSVTEPESGAIIGAIEKNL